VQQVVIGWTNSHLCQFGKDGQYWGGPESDDYGDDLIDESKVEIGTILQAEGDSLTYVYDLGDKWRHTVFLEKIVPTEVRTKPVCLDGARRCPPEDVGGAHGYKEFLEVIFEPDHEEFEHFREFVGDPVHAEEFNVAAVNEILERMRWPRRHHAELRGGSVRD
jgi:hypothetical protein